MNLWHLYVGFKLFKDKGCVLLFSLSPIFLTLLLSTYLIELMNVVLVLNFYAEFKNLQD